MVELGRRAALGALGLGGAAVVLPQLGGASVRGNPSAEALVGDFAGKRAMLLHRQRAPLLETPFEVFDKSVFTPNDQFFVRWHYADIPLEVDAAAFRLRVDGAVSQPLALSLPELLAMPRVELNAVNQCSGNSRALFSPRVPGAQWGNGAMGNARWTGVRLKDVLARAGVRPGAARVRFAGLDRPPEGADWFAKSLGIDHALDGEVMIAFAMNGAALPLLNGFPLRLVVPGWFSTYWIKSLDHIEVLTGEDENFWMAKAYRIPTAPNASVMPGAKDFPTTPINRMVPRSFFTSHKGDIHVSAGAPLHLRGVAMGGASGVARVELSLDGQHWTGTTLGRDHGTYSLRAWSARLTLAAGTHLLHLRCTNADGQTQMMTPIWNPSGYMLNTIEQRRVIVA